MLLYGVSIAHRVLLGYGDRFVLTDGIGRVY